MTTRRDVIKGALAGLAGAFLGRQALPAPAPTPEPPAVTEPLGRFATGGVVKGPGPFLVGEAPCETLLPMKRRHMGVDLAKPGADATVVVEDLDPKVWAERVRVALDESRLKIEAAGRAFDRTRVHTLGFIAAAGPGKTRTTQLMASAQLQEYARLHRERRGLIRAGVDPASLEEPLAPW